MPAMPFGSRFIAKLRLRPLLQQLEQGFRSGAHIAWRCGRKVPRSKSSQEDAAIDGVDMRR
jgi:hypothetical protein